MIIQETIDAAKVLAGTLVRDGLLPVACIEDENRRTLLVWGVMRVDYSKVTGMASVLMLNETNDLPYVQRHLVWEKKVSCHTAPFDELLINFCQWTVKSRLMVYGYTADLAAKAMEDELIRLTGAGRLNWLWRRFFNRWLIPSDLSRIARKAYGINFSIKEFNRINQHKEIAREVDTSSPNMLPILGWILCAKDTQVEQLFFGRQVTVKEFFDGFRQALMHFYPAVRRPEDVHGLESILDLPFSQWVPQRFSASAWRFLVRQRTPVVRALIKPNQPDISPAILNLEYLAAVAEDKLQSGILRFMDRREFYEITEDFDLKVRFLRLLTRKLNSNHDASEPVRALILDDAGLVLDWLRNEGFRNGWPQRNSSWPSLMRQQQAWHENAPWNFSGVAFKDVSWNSALGAMHINDCEVRPLTSTNELRREGAEMHHCVAKYWSDCQRGTSRVFSLCSSAGRSTLELRVGESICDIAQHRGRRNVAPPQSHINVAQKILEAYQAAMSESENQVFEDENQLEALAF